MGTFNTPANVKYSIAAIAHEKEITQKQVADQVLVNAKKLFGI
jgi:Tat protein secretion system quality control protein TatD with DNase activity